jgi:hypothetical protein
MKTELVDYPTNLENIEQRKVIGKNFLANRSYLRKSTINMRQKLSYKNRNLAIYVY